MGDRPKFEPFLQHKLVAFNGFFTLNDPAMNTSEIKPIHLSIPKNCPGVVKNLSPRVQPNMQDMTTIRPAGARLLSTAALARTAQRARENAADTSPRAEPTPSRSPRPEAPPSRSPRTEAAPSRSPREETPKKSQRAEETPKKDQGTTVGPQIGSSEDMKHFFAKPDVVVLPFAPNLGGRFAFNVSVVKGKTVFGLKGGDGKKVMLWASMDGSSIRKKITVHAGDAIVGQTVFDADSEILYCGHKMDDGSALQEVMAIHYNKSFMKKSKVRSFDAIIPALKKISGQSRMIPVAFSESKSTLYEKLKSKSKEAIMLKGRLPEDAGGSYDTKFGNKFAKASDNNFILYHESKPRNNICAFSASEKEGSYILEIGYPMTTIQGFFAAVAAIAPM